MTRTLIALILMTIPVHAQGLETVDITFTTTSSADAIEIDADGRCWIAGQEIECEEFDATIPTPDEQAAIWAQGIPTPPATGEKP